jgi:hypothetical protein
VPGS